LYAWWRTASSSPSASSCPTAGPRRALTPPWTGGNPWRRVRLSCCFRPRPWRTPSSSTRALSTAPTCSATSPTSTAASTRPRSSRSRCGRWTFVLTQLSHAPRSPSVHGGGCTTSCEVEPVTAASSCPWDTRSCPALCPPYFCFRAISIHFSSLLLHFSVLLPVSYWIWPRLGVGMVGTDRVAAAPGNMISVRWLGLGPHEFSVHYRPLWTAQIRTYYIRVIMQLLHSCIRLENQ
jgi:hypothetical protein